MNAKFSLRDMVDSVLEIISELVTLMTAYASFLEPDSETLTNDTR